MNDRISYTIKESSWDRDFFNCSVAKVHLNNRLNDEAFSRLMEDCKQFEFVMIQNICNDPRNNYYLGKDSQAYLVDVNIQFALTVKKEMQQDTMSVSEHITISEPKNQVEPNDLLCEMIENNIIHSKFYNDPAIGLEKGKQLYASWVRNSFQSPQKWFVTAYDNNTPIGFILCHFEDQVCTIELIVVEKKQKDKKIGTRMIGRLTAYCAKNGIKTICVGTQADNINAIAFYVKSGFFVIGTNSNYHLWNR